MPTATVTLLDVVDLRAAVRLIDRAAPGLRDQLDASLKDALRGRPAAVRAYVRAYATLVERLLFAFHEARPDLVARDDAGDFVVQYAGGRRTKAPVDLLHGFAADAPFTAWVAAKGLGTGVALDLLARMRALLPGADPLPLPRAAVLPSLSDDPDALLRFTRRVARELQAGDSDLRHVRETFGLNVTEVGRLFGVSRQAAASWLAGEPPAARRPKAACLAAIADVLARRLKPARIPGVVRAPAPAYGGKSMLELVAADRHEWLLESVRASFDYAATA
jgi:hypothetical protein